MSSEEYIAQPEEGRRDGEACESVVAPVLRLTVSAVFAEY